MPARITSIPPRATIKTIWNSDATSATRPSTIIRNGPSPRPGPPGTDDRARSTPMFCPKHAESVATSHDRELLMMVTARRSAAVTKSPMIVTPAPATTTRVSRLFTRSLPGSARCSQTMRTPPRITDSTAAAPMYHHSWAWMNSTAPPTPCGPFGITMPTMPLAAEMRTTAERISPTFPSAATPSPARILDAISPPRMNRDRMAIANEIHMT